ncbi:MAG: hypothetical protein U1F67_09315 [Rubrivivax sp.]
MVIPTPTRVEPDDIEARWGETGVRFVALLRDCANVLFDTARKHAIAAEAEQTGWVQPVHTPGRIAISERRVRQWSRRGAPVELLDAAQARRMLGLECSARRLLEPQRRPHQPGWRWRAAQQRPLQRRAARLSAARRRSTSPAPANSGSFARRAARCAHGPWCWRPTPTPGTLARIRRRGALHAKWC